MNIKQLIGEVGRNEIIDIGDEIIVTHYDGSKKKKLKGILIKADENKIQVNRKVIENVDILKIDKT